MKSLILLMFALAFILACGGEESETPTTDELEAVEEAEPEPEPAPEPKIETIGLVEFELHGKNISFVAYEYWGFIKNIGDVDLENVYIKIGGPAGSEMNELGYYRPTSTSDNSLPVGDSTRLEYLFYQDYDARPGTWTAQVWSGDELVGIAGEPDATLSGSLRFMTSEEQRSRLQ